METLLVSRLSADREYL